MYKIKKGKVQSGDMAQWMRYSLAVQDTRKARYICNLGASMGRGGIYSEFLESHR